MRFLFGLLLLSLGFVASVSMAADTAEELTGKWVGEKAADPPLEFTKDGKFKFGWSKKKDGTWDMANGTFKIDKSGKIKADATKGAVGVTLELTLEKGKLSGGLGGKNYIWKKEEEKKEEEKKEEKK